MTTTTSEQHFVETQRTGRDEEEEEAREGHGNREREGNTLQDCLRYGRGHLWRNETSASSA
ncbi:hypothetical protein K0M31_017498 [Melipona bicolor]|uniref:Uncharacterized protein n=1 Tax=Melipona bicolor TaxID=60889 RepID=A0AA40G4Z8_9HYME|nr:hypothetical protein K0M31_017498 [Melipona bicolor]